MENTVKQRLIKFLKYKKLSQSKFEKCIGAGNGYVNNISKSIGADKLQSIIGNFPELNQDWLLTGNGSMLQDNAPKPASTEINIEKFLDIMQKQADSLERRDNQIDELISMLKKGNAQADDNARCAAVNE